VVSTTPPSVTAQTALVLSGGGRYNDPWHPFEQTSARLADLLVDEGWAVELDDDPEAALARLSTAEHLPSLVVANFGLPRDGAASPLDQRSVAGLKRLQRDAVPLLVSHVSITSFVDMPLWASTVGGQWIRGRSMHPDYGDAHIQVEPRPLTAGLANFTLRDERYTDLEVDSAVEVLASHHHGDRDHPLIWLNPIGEWRIAYDGLGHDAKSYDSPEHQLLLRRCIRWLAEAL
jgi:type 1 glutamine amidotransferase